MAELANMVELGHRAVVLYLVQRTDCEAFAVADDIDPAYNTAFLTARATGVKALCHRATLTLVGANLGEALPIVSR
jgi:sugar fermentation stimulation protein A